MLGGTDNALFNWGNSDLEIDPDIPYTYQARITPLRGFQTILEWSKCFCGKC